jgi:hypothetical protein
VTSATIERVDGPADAASERASRPGTRLPARDALGVLMAAVGGFAAAMGALLVWVTVGIPNESGHTEIRGVDLAEGRAVFLCAVLMLAAAVWMRLVKSASTRRAPAALAASLGLAALAIGASFLLHGVDRSPVVAAVGISRDLWERFGVFRNLGIGPFLAVAGGVVGVGGAALTARRVPPPTADAASG